MQTFRKDRQHQVQCRRQPQSGLCRIRMYNHITSLLLFFSFFFKLNYSFFLLLQLQQTDLHQAINMVSYYASSSEPASIRGKHVYIQYSNRHEIVNNKGPADVPGNVLLVTIEGVQAPDVTIDVIHLVSISLSTYVADVKSHHSSSSFLLLSFSVASKVIAFFITIALVRVCISMPLF